MFRFNYLNIETFKTATDVTVDFAGTYNPLEKYYTLLKDNTKVLQGQQTYTKEDIEAGKGIFLVTANTLTFSHNFKYGTYIQEVQLLPYDPDYKIYEFYDDGWGNYATKIALGKVYDVFSFDTINTFKLNIDRNYLHYMCASRDVDTIKRFYEHETYTDYFDTNIFPTIDTLCNLENVKIVDYIYNELEITHECTEGSVECASTNGNIDMLNWLRDNTSFLYSKKAINNASKNGHNHVLDWWKKSGLPLIYTATAMNCASGYGHVETLNWWKNSGLELRYTKESIDSATVGKHIKVLEWWKNSGLTLEYTEFGLDNIMMYTNYQQYMEGLEQNAIVDKDKCEEVLNWWTNSGLEMKYSEILFTNLCNAYENDWFLRILKLFEDAKLKIKCPKVKYFNKYCDHEYMGKDFERLTEIYTIITKAYKDTVFCIDDMFNFNDCRIIEWWFKSGAKIIFSEYKICSVNVNVLLDMLNLFQKYDKEIMFNKQTIQNLLNSQNNIPKVIAVLQWLHDNGIKIDYFTLNNVVSTDILDWIHNSGIRMKYGNSIITSAIKNNNIKMLNWWKDSGLLLKYHDSIFGYLLDSSTSIEVAEWIRAIKPRNRIQCINKYICDSNISKRLYNYFNPPVTYPQNGLLNILNNSTDQHMLT